MSLFQDPKLVKLLKFIQDNIKDTLFENRVFVVGGAVRDSLLNIMNPNLKKQIKDIDLCVDVENGAIMLAAFLAVRSQSYKEGKNPVTYGSFSTAKVQITSDDELKDFAIECVTPIKSYLTKTQLGTLQEDTSLRDFTVNAIYYNISTEKIYDYCNGLTDLRKGIIRTTAKPNITFGNDPSRILRAIRLSVQCNFGISKDTWLGMIEYAEKVENVVKEKTTDELTKMLVAEKPSRAIEKMYNCGVLDKILPDIYELRTVKESIKPLVSAYTHVLEVMDATQPFIENRLAALFHNVALILTSTCTLDDLDEFSADVASIDMGIMKYPTDMLKRVERAIKLHNYFEQYDDDEIPSDKKIRKFINECGDNLELVADLMHANNVHSTNKKPTQVLKILNRYEELENEADLKNPQLPVNGKDLQEYLNLKPSPMIGIMLSDIKDAYFENPNITKEECLAIAKEKYIKLAV